MSFHAPNFFERQIDFLFCHAILRNFYRRYAESLGLKGNERVLELGAGTGPLSRHLARLVSAGGGVVCLDTAESRLAVARKRLRGHANVDFKVGDVVGLTGEESGFDAVVIHFTLHDIDRDQRPGVIQALARLLKACGRVFVREPTKKKHGMAPEEIRRLMTASGLRAVSGAASAGLIVGPMWAGVFEKPG